MMDNRDVVANISFNRDIQNKRATFLVAPREKNTPSTVTFHSFKELNKNFERGPFYVVRVMKIVTSFYGLTETFQEIFKLIPSKCPNLTHFAICNIPIHQFTQPDLEINFFRAITFKLCVDPESEKQKIIIYIKSEVDLELYSTKENTIFELHYNGKEVKFIKTNALYTLYSNTCTKPVELPNEFVIDVCKRDVPHYF